MTDHMTDHMTDQELVDEDRYNDYKTYVKTFFTLTVHGLIVCVKVLGRNPVESL